MTSRTLKRLPRGYSQVDPLGTPEGKGFESFQVVAGSANFPRSRPKRRARAGSYDPSMGIEEQIAGAERLTSVFGCWPTFHDAMVHWIRIQRDPPGGGAGPELEALLHKFEITGEAGPDGLAVLRKHVLVLLRFHECDVVKLEGFNHQNALIELEIHEVRDPRRKGTNFSVQFVAGHGVEAHIECRALECVSVTACDADGTALPASTKG